jgi:hypothetical protein
MIQDQSSHGGARTGAGRKPGSATTRTREIADKAVGKGITPLEVMLLSMRFHMAEFDKSQSLDALSSACLSAKDAAPYIHPRLAAVEHSGDENNPLQHSIRVTFG